MDWPLIAGIVGSLVAVWALLLVLLFVFRPKDVALGDVIRVVPDLLRLIRSLIADRTVPLGVRGALLGLLAWLVSPIDLIPEFIPVLGPLDDVVVAVLVLRYVRRRIGVAELRRRWPGSPDGFELLNRVLGTTGGAATETPALTALAGSGLAFEVVRTDIAESPMESAALQGISLEALLRTIVVRRGEEDYLFVLVPGGRRFDWPRLRAHLGVSRLSLPDAGEARDATGYERGAITPFGSRVAWPVIVDAAAMAQERVAIGGGARGVNIHLAPGDLVTRLEAAVVDVTRAE